MRRNLQISTNGLWVSNNFQIVLEFFEFNKAIWNCRGFFVFFFFFRFNFMWRIKMFRFTRTQFTWPNTKKYKTKITDSCNYYSGVANGYDFQFKFVDTWLFARNRWRQPSSLRTDINRMSVRLSTASSGPRCELTSVFFLNFRTA